jgi:hypothetical protein
MTTIATRSTAIAAAACLALGGCASVFDSKDQSTISVDSNPQGALVRLNGADKGTTPVEFVVSDKEVYELSVTHEGQTRQIQLTRSIGAVWIVVDILFGLIPVIVDAITGNWYEVGPDKIFIDFTAGAPAAE